MPDEAVALMGRRSSRGGYTRSSETSAGCATRTGTALCGACGIGRTPSELRGTRGRVLRRRPDAERAGERAPPRRSRGWCRGSHRFAPIAAPLERAAVTDQRHGGSTSDRCAPSSSRPDRRRPTGASSTRSRSSGKRRRTRRSGSRRSPRSCHPAGSFASATSTSRRSTTPTSRGPTWSSSRACSSSSSRCAGCSRRARAMGRRTVVGGPAPSTAPELVRRGRPRVPGRGRGPARPARAGARGAHAGGAAPPLAAGRRAPRPARSPACRGSTSSSSRGTPATRSSIRAAARSTASSATSSRSSGGCRG